MAWLNWELAAQSHNHSASPNPALHSRLQRKGLGGVPGGFTPRHRRHQGTTTASLRGRLGLDGALGSRPPHHVAWRWAPGRLHFLKTRSACRVSQKPSLCSKGESADRRSSGCLTWGLNFCPGFIYIKLRLLANPLPIHAPKTQNRTPLTANRSIS